MYGFVKSTECKQSYDMFTLGRVDKRDSLRPLIVILAGICDGDQLGTKPNVGRGVGVL